MARLATVITRGSFLPAALKTASAMKTAPGSLVAV